MNIIINILVGVGIVGLGVLYYKKKIDVSTASSMMSTVGVLGTFIGICVGLVGFDVNSISTSVPYLLDGMKTAFITSIMGMGGALIVKGLDTRSKSDDEDNVDDILELFNRMLKTNKETNELLLENQNKTVDVLEKITEKWDEGQNTLIKEISSLNVNLTTKQDELISEFKVFREEMTKSNTEALIEALEGVIKDFNVKITEQFGENFKELNSAVGKLLEWQDNYKVTVETTYDKLDQNFNSLNIIKENLDEISKSTEIMSSNNTKLNDVLIKIDNNQENLENGLDKLVEIANKAEEGIPKINEYFENSMSKVNELTETLKENSVNMNEHIKEVEIKFNSTLNAFTSEITNTMEITIQQIEAQCEKMKSTNSKVHTELDEVLREVSESVKGQCDLITSTNTSMQQNLEDTLIASAKRVESLGSDTSKEISVLVSEMEKIFKGKVEQLDSVLEEELNKSLNSLGSQLVTLSEKFTTDYGSLADKLKEIVEISERVY